MDSISNISSSTKHHTIQQQYGEVEPPKEIEGHSKQAYLQHILQLSWWELKQHLVGVRLGYLGGVRSHMK